jgi:hypothetical protein
MDFITFKKSTVWNKNRLTTFKKSNHYSTAIDSTLVRKVMSKNFKMTCPCCKRKVELRYMELDHIEARFNGGLDINANVAYLCASCHNKKSLLELMHCEGSAEYKAIQRKELKSKKENEVLYSLFEFISRASKKMLREHPRYSLRLILLKVATLFGLGLVKIRKLLKGFCNLFTLRRKEVESFENDLKNAKVQKVA